MSTKRLNADERATYLIGQAVRRILTAPTGAYSHTLTWLAWKAYSKILPAVLTADETDAVMITTGCIGECWEGEPEKPATPILAGLTDCYLSALQLLHPDPEPDRQFTDEEREEIKSLTRRIWQQRRPKE